MPKLKRLQLIGYKTFAARTEFLFDEGITAIVGPNGSGKSNIADAMRWALGEQSFRSLRGRQTTDMIFHGSDQRARLGMASVEMVLDNASGWLPLDFQEVAVGRRAYRSGQNEYILNGSRVRLRDITDTLGATGLGQRTYNVIGQGLVDAALSLRPEERRPLFEEASGIAAHKDKRQEALDRLDETEANLQRVSDIVNEITPSLKRLKAQAEKADQLLQVKTDLVTLLGTWHAYRWGRSLHNLHQGATGERQIREALEQRRRNATAFGHTVDELLTQHTRLRDQTGTWHRQSADLHRQSEASQRELAVLEERRHQIAERIDALDNELAGIAARIEAQTQRSARTEDELARLDERREEHCTVVAQAQETFQLRDAGYQAHRDEVEHLQRATLDAVAADAETEHRRQQLADRAAQLLSDRQGHEVTLERTSAEQAELQSTLDAVNSQLRNLQARHAKQAAEEEALALALSAAIAEEDKAASVVQERLRREAQLADRLSLLTSLKQQGEGQPPGSRELLRHPPSGMQGIATNGLHVPPQYETAVEAVLGPRLHAVAVDRWSDAEAAIDWLKSKDAGRAILLPLDFPTGSDVASIPSLPGIKGLAADILSAEQQPASALKPLLERTLIIQDLSVARQILQQYPDLAQVLYMVTLSGEIVDPHGGVTGGSGGSDGTLARQRQIRELPSALAQAQQRTVGAQSALAHAREVHAQADSSLQVSRSSAAELERDSARQRSKHSDIRSKLDLVTQRREWHRSLLADAIADLDRHDTESIALQSKATELASELSRLNSDLARARELAASADPSSIRSHLASLQAELALVDSQREGVLNVLSGQRENLADLRQEMLTKQRRRGQLIEQHNDIAADVRSHTDRLATLSTKLQHVSSQLAPAEAELARIDGERSALQVKERQLQDRIREDELRASKALLAVERHQDELQSLHREIEADLGPVRLQGIETLTFLQPMLPLELPSETLPPVGALADGIDSDIRRLRRQERRMGNVNPNAPEEYQQALTRHRFLSEQTEDLVQATASLREVIAHLDRLMLEDFSRTFKAVDERFRIYFTRLFNGGTAHLELTRPNDPTTTGIEIIARPPGKRAQGLALLSGGERSLTAMALIFAILSVSPPPFCVLDEVDAMLDEVNVGRFRDLLKELSSATQMVIITHNRHTIEAADTIYGVSMGSDSVSQVVSIKIHGQQIAD